MKKRVIALLLVIILTIGTLPIVFAVSGFTDVPDDVWYESPIDYVQTHGLMAGVGENRFAPMDSMTRAMAVTVLYRIAGTPTVSSTTPFDDIADDDWYTKAIQWAVWKNITAGTSDRTFSPNRNVSREELVTFLYRYACSCDIGLSARDIRDFSDYDQISAYAVAPFEWAVQNQIISGVGHNRIAPKEHATRAQCAAILMRFDQMLNGNTEQPNFSEPEDIHPEVPEVETSPTDCYSDNFAAEAAASAAAFINQWREDQNSRQCEYLPGMQKVAMYRAGQLVENFSHDEADNRVAHAYYEYGQYIDATQWGDPPERSYWSSGANEAITRYGTGDISSAEEVGYQIAKSIWDSPSHWQYIGDDMYSYIAVGVKIVPGSDEGSFLVFGCVMVNDKNYG